MVSQSLTAPPSKDDAKGWYGAARTMAKKMVSDTGRERDRKRDADACLLACRRCARTLGHALLWSNDSSIADELRLSVEHEPQGSKSPQAPDHRKTGLVP